MIDLYSWKTSNGRKMTIMLEELGVDYTLHLIALPKREQFSPEFTAINPNQKIPAMIDQDGPGGKPYTMIESGAMLIYLAEKYGKFFPQEPIPRYETIQWLMFQMGNIGPMFGQAHHFRRRDEKVPYGIERYTKETRKLWGVLDQHLATRKFLAAEQYTIADIATFPWTARYEWQGISLDEFPNVKRWFETIYARPAVKRGMDDVYDELLAQN
ncbi:MAG: glutathione S-transferase family protein [Acidiferrobacterales bacterium]